MTQITPEYEWLFSVPDEDALELVPESVRELVELIGWKATVRLVLRFQGQQLYVPKSEGAFRQLRDRRIREEFNGANHEVLGRRYGLTTSHIYKILSPTATDLQEDLFAAGE